MTRAKVKMDMNLFIRIVDDAVKNGFTDLLLSNYGEPFLDDRIFDRIKYAKEKGLRVGARFKWDFAKRRDNQANYRK